MTARFGPILLSLPLFLLMLLYLEPTSSRSDISNNRAFSNSPKTKLISVKKKHQHPLTGKQNNSQPISLPIIRSAGSEISPSKGTDRFYASAALCNSRFHRSPIKPFRPGKGKKSQLYTDDLPSYPTTVISEIKENTKRKKSKKKKRINDKKASKIIPVYPPIHPLKASALLMSLLKLSNYLSDPNSVNKNTVESLANLSSVTTPTPPPTVSNVVTKSPSTDEKSDDLSAIPGDGFLISDLIADLLLAMFGY